MKKVNILIISSIFFCSFCLIKGYGFRYNASQSLPHILYFSMPEDKPQLGHIVTFKLPESRVTFAKIIEGAAGDLIQVKEAKIYINDIEKCELVPGFQPIAEQIIPDGCFFVLGNHSESFDSRYADFGLVSKDLIGERLCPLF